nr:immunoglobulin heavy chain junction region [Macaca mulatta]MOW98501.1 immunoglobulin heavy chain junction region [Macaca mulatta]MOW99038.1 immunoglobulin heavy chain junction region [Macaca mulatta]MOW99495.1 immunoglobulin heavy chain junction region [Macaca mulatta]MOW99576.1 immunoglobulin heavy chain junction region [Macaca mulatta]
CVREYMYYSGSRYYVAFDFW